MTTIHEQQAFDHASPAGTEHQADLASALRDVLAEFRIISRRFNRSEMLLLIVLISLFWTIFEIRENTDALLAIAQACRAG